MKKLFFWLFFLTLLIASPVYAQYVERTDCGTFTPTGNGGVCKQLTTTGGRTAQHLYIWRSGAWVDVDTSGSGAPTSSTYITQTADGTLGAEQALGLLATGLLKSTTTTGVVSIAVPGTDYYVPGGTDIPVADGGTGVSTLAIHGVLVGNAASAVNVTTPGTAGQVLTSNGASADPTFQAPVSGPAAAGTLTGTTLASNVTASSLTSFATSPTLNNPAIANFSNANHTHTGATTGGTLDAAAVATGVLAPARLGSGGGGATKFLREDSTFQSIPGGGDAMTTDPLSQFVATTSAELAGVISNETGSGALVFGTNPTLTNPVLTTPTLGVAAATSVNKVAITAPATSATLTIVDGATLTASASATVSGTNTGDQTITLTGDVTGTGVGSFATTIAADSVALGTDTTGNYVSSATANQGLLLTGTEGASLGLIDCAANQIIKRNAGDTAWECAADSTGASPAFDAIIGGTNTTAAMVVGTGATLAVSGSGTIAATTAAALAANGANCTSGSAPLGVDASGAVESCFDVATQTELDAHINAATAHVASTIGYTPGNPAAWDDPDPTEVATAVDTLRANLNTLSDTQVTSSGLTANKCVRATGTLAIGDGSCTDDGSGNVSYGAANGNGQWVGVPTMGGVKLDGSNSGQALITVPAVAGTPTVTLGTSSGTPAVTASSPLAITAATGNITCATCVTTANIVDVELVVVGFTTALTTGDGKYYFVIPPRLTGMNLIAVSAHVITVSSSGAVNVDLARCAVVATGNTCSGTVVDMLSTNLTIDANESKSSTAAAAAVIDTSNDDVVTDQAIRIDVDGAGTGTQGLIVILRFQLP